MPIRIPDKISSKDVAVIVQGHVRGKPGDSIEDRWTELSLLGVRRFLPDAQLILSTFKECDVSGLSYDQLVLSDDPGYLDLGDLNRMVGNTNRQIVSTRAGLKKADRKFVLKMRYDLVLEGDYFLSYFARYQERVSDWRIFQQRIISCTSVSLNARKRAQVPFAPSDWFHFGLREDVCNLWDVPLIPEAKAPSNPNSPRKTIYHYQPSHRHTAEQYLWVSFLRKYGAIELRRVNDLSGNALEMTDLTIANNLVLLEPDQIPVRCLKYFDANLLTYSKQLNYSHAEWLRLYEKICMRKRPYAGTRIQLTPAPSPAGPARIAHDRLARIGVRVVESIDSIDPNRLVRLQNGSSVRIEDTGPAPYHKALTGLMQIVNPSLVVEIGMNDGLTALFLRAGMSSGSCLATVDSCCFKLNDQVAEPMSRKDLSDEELIELKLDLSLPAELERIMPYLARAEVIVFNLSDGRIIKSVLERLSLEQRVHEILVTVNRIHCWPLADIWTYLPSPKMDLPLFGHSEGLALATLCRNTIAPNESCQRAEMPASGLSSMASVQSPLAKSTRPEPV